MKKIGILCLALVLALGSLGIGFATWSDQLYVEGTVETGEVLIGFVDQVTDDDGVPGLKDPDDFGPDPIAAVPPITCTDCPNIGKDVASTTCVLSDQKIHCDGVTPAEHDGKPQYGLMTITMTNVYPQYNPTVWFDIANCGTIPVNITGAEIIEICGTPITPIPLPKCTMVQVDLSGDGLDDIAIGFSGPADQQIDECEVKQFDLHFYVKQDCPPCTELCFKIKIHAVQWNKA